LRGWTPIDQASIVRASAMPLRSTRSARAGSNGLPDAVTARSVKICRKTSRPTISNVMPANTSIISISRW
jgi:hypothetical protein